MDCEMYLRGLLYGSSLSNPKQLSVKCVATKFKGSVDRIKPFVAKIRKQGDGYSCLLKHRWEACLIEKDLDFMAGFLDSNCCSVLGKYVVIRVNQRKVDDFNKLKIPLAYLNMAEGRQRRWCKTHSTLYYYSSEPVNGIDSLRLSIIFEPQRLNEESIEKLEFGTLLGDAYISKDYYFYLNHSTKQEEWLRYKAGRLGKASQEVTYRRDKSGYESCRVRFLLNSDEEKSLRIVVYKPLVTGGYRKTITKELLDKYLSKEAFTWWYLDDGGVKNQRYHSLCMASFSIEECKIVRQFLYKKWKLKTSINHDNKYLSLYFARETTPRFLKLISPFVPECMVYKLGYLSNDIVPSQQKC
jgi:hypothetical protein